MIIIVLNNHFDNCVAFHIDNGAFRGRLVRMNEVINTILNKHKYPLPVSAVLAEAIVLAAMLASNLKYKGLFTLQTQSNGPVSLIVVDVTSEGKIRAYARFDEQRLTHSQQLRKTDGQIEPAPHLMGEGHLAFTVDQGPDTELYQGVVDLQGKTMSELALRYFKQSEQIDTWLQLYLKAPEGDSQSWQAAGLMLQKLPEIGGKIQEGDDLNAQWEEAKVFAESLREDEIFDAELSSAELLHRLFHANNLVISKSIDYSFGCRCSREKLLNTLSGFSPEEIESMVEKNKITAECSFCSEKYSFDKGEVLKQ